MNAWWMGLAKVQNKNCSLAVEGRTLKKLLHHPGMLRQDGAGRLPVFESQHPALASKYPTYNGICDQKKSAHTLLGVWHERLAVKDL
jgi:hypothetical protein